MQCSFISIDLLCDIDKSRILTFAVVMRIFHRVEHPLCRYNDAQQLPRVEIGEISHRIALCEPNDFRDEVVAI